MRRYHLSNLTDVSFAVSDFIIISCHRYIVIYITARIDLIMGKINQSIRKNLLVKDFWIFDLYEDPSAKKSKYQLKSSSIDI